MQDTVVVEGERFIGWFDVDEFVYVTPFGFMED